MSEYFVTVCKDGGKEEKIPAPAGASFLRLLKGNGYPLICCNGKGGCGRCRIRFLGNAPLPMPADRNALTAQELREGVRLACMHRVKKECRIRVEFVPPGQVEVVTDYAGAEAAGKVCEPYVLAVDLGTTTIAANAVSLPSMQEKGGLQVLAHSGRMNPQRAWGSDVISRIQAAARGEEKAMQEEAQSAVAALITEIVGQTGRLPESVCLAGNTVMEHLFLGLDVSGLGQYPFRPVSLKEQRTRLPLHLSGPSFSQDCEVCLLPGISAFVGADVLAGLLACGFGNTSDKRCRLFIDLGTNGEMAIGNGERLICTATAAGPAFEGGASANVPGTDMIALLARLLREKKIDRTGLLCEELFDEGWREGKLRVTQQDIRSLQMAKAAVRVGVELLMQKLGASDASVEEVYLAGGFGRFLDVESAAVIGLIPEGLAGKVKAVGNTSLLGAALYGGKPEGPALAAALAEQAEVMNLAEEPGFYEKYMANLEF